MRSRIRINKQLGRRFALVFALAVLVFPAMTAAAQSTGGIGGRVANPDPNNPRSQSIFIYTLEHGDVKEDQLLVMNKTDEEQTITIGSVDGVVTNSGDYTCRQEAEPVEDSGGWVKLDKKELTLPAGGEELVKFTVTVPEKADVGEHNSCLTVFQTNQDPAEGEDTGGVHIRMRQAIRMVITIPGELKRDISIKSFSVKQNVNDQNYTLVAANMGNISADIDMRVAVASIFGKEVANVGGEYPVVPGESLSKEFTTELKPMFGGWYKATPSLRYDKRLGVFGTSSQQAEYETITGAPVDMFFWPTTLGWIIIAIVIILLLTIITLLVKRSRKRKHLKKSSHPYKVEKDDTLESLAQKSNVTWQELATLNKLKAPYTLKEGEEILLPGENHTVHKKHRPSKHKE